MIHPQLRVMTHVLSPAPSLTIHVGEPIHPCGPSPRDWGGYILTYMLKVFIADPLGARIEVRGTCISACTVLLSGKDVCVHPDAMLWFHAAKVPETGKMDAEATRTMSLYWGPKNAAWAEAVGATQSLAFTRRRPSRGWRRSGLALSVARSKPELGHAGGGSTSLLLPLTFAPLGQALSPPVSRRRVEPKRGLWLRRPRQAQGLAEPSTEKQLLLLAQRS